ncbi:hypothetical protein [Edaphocola aurantiacus]|uniref:hypothetical protein n=1 Tax=Edaphocola aurantiacus TaxID=2601682 RepID=UPI001C96B739|nr:hypothetical protein [Edaphocola aurantiacus]
MKKLLVLIPAIGMSLTACQKDEAKNPARSKTPNINLMTIQGQVATRHWDKDAEDCLNGGNDCFDEVVCTPSFWDMLWDAYWKSKKGEYEAWRECSTTISEGTDNHNEDFRKLIGEDMFQKVLSGELKLKLRINENKENALFLGVFDPSDPAAIKLVIPVTKSN